MWKDISLWFLLVTTFLSLSAWALVINKISPYESAHIAIPGFYATFFLSLTTTFTVVGSLLRKFASPGKKMLRCINISLRQGVILSAVGCICMWLEQTDVFTWWIGVLLLLIGVVMETLFWEME